MEVSVISYIGFDATCDFVEMVRRLLSVAMDVMYYNKDIRLRTLRES